MTRSLPARKSRFLLVLAAVVTVALWQVPGYGELILYPFSLFATYVHEMGHGLTALLLGARFEALRMFPDGSGLAAWRGDVGRLGRALIAAGGLVGPSVAGAVLLAVSRYGRSKTLLLAGGILIGLSGLVAGNLFALVFIASVALSLGAASRWLPPTSALFLIQFLGVQLCIALFRDVDYMFSPGGIINGQRQNSDSAAIAEALLLPYWFWGGLTALFSFTVLVLGLRTALRRPKSSHLKT